MTGLSALVLCGLLGAPAVQATVSTGPAAAPLAAATPDAGGPGGFTPAQVEAIGRIAGEYVASHPQVLVTASQALQAQQMAAQRTAMAQAVLTHQDALLRTPHTPSLGPADAKVAVVEFFDYQCVYCSKMAPVVKGAIKVNPAVRFVFKEFPIFGTRWAPSQYAAEAGQAVWALKGATGYQAYHDGLFATGKNEGALTFPDINMLLTSVGVSPEAVSGNAVRFKTQLTGNMQLGQALGLSGTPAFVVMPQRGATADNTTVLPGAVTADQLQAAINLAAGQAK
jgi:protein-disulfide isomerase